MTYTDTKICRTCSETKSLDDFYPKSRKTKGGTVWGHMTHCKKCYSEINRQKYLKKAEARRDQQRRRYQENRETFVERSRLYREENQEKVRATKKQYRERNKDKILDANRKYRAENRNKVRDYWKTYRKENEADIRSWRKKNSHYFAAHSAMRRASKQNATPAWLTADQHKNMSDQYWLAKDASSVSDTLYHVDHIVPLNNEHVCGLHVPWNLQILPADLNIAKYNSFALWWVDC